MQTQLQWDNFTTKEQGRGSEIGLYMAKMIVENNMAGQMTVRNKHCGAEFTIAVHGKQGKVV